jgi:hypothetical protein
MSAPCTAASPARSTCQVQGADDNVARCHAVASPLLSSRAAHELTQECNCPSKCSCNCSKWSNAPPRHGPAVDELPAALQLSGAEWAERYRFPKPGPGAPVVLQCRTQRRASWAAQLAADAGLHNVLVYKQVTRAGCGPATSPLVLPCVRLPACAAYW